METVKNVFEIATKIGTPLMLAAVVIFAFFFVCLSLMKKVNKPSKSHSYQTLRLVLWMFFVLGLVSLILGFVGFVRDSSVYRVRVTVLDNGNRPVNGAEIISAPSGERKNSEAGGEIVIPQALLSQDRILRVWATGNNGTLKGYTELTLGDDHYPSVTVVLQHDTTARIRGQVEDEDGKPISAGIVYVQNYPTEKAMTDLRGRFDVAAHVAANEHVHLIVEAEGYEPWNDFVPAGGDSLAMISVTKKK